MTTRAGLESGDHAVVSSSRGSAGDSAARRQRSASWVRTVDLAVKGSLVMLLALVVVNPAYGNLEGKAPVTRAVTYPMLAFALPLFWRLTAREWRQFPWAADLLITLSCFSDILGNRLDLYDSIVWFDDWMHFLNTGLLSGAVVLLTTRPTDRLGTVLERAIAAGTTMSLAWELYEYASFMTDSSERPMAYPDTLGDLCLGWVGACVAGLLVHRLRRRGSAPLAQGTAAAARNP